MICCEENNSYKTQSTVRQINRLVLIRGSVKITEEACHHSAHCSRAAVSHVHQSRRF